MGWSSVAPSGLKRKPLSHWSCRKSVFTEITALPEVKTGNVSGSSSKVKLRLLSVKSTENWCVEVLKRAEHDEEVCTNPGGPLPEVNRKWLYLSARSPDWSQTKTNIAVSARPDHVRCCRRYPPPRTDRKWTGSGAFTAIEIPTIQRLTSNNYNFSCVIKAYTALMALLIPTGNWTETSRKPYENWPNWTRNFSPQCNALI